MQQISEVMTRNVRVVSPDDSLQSAARVMDEMNVGAVPVCNGDRLVGMITDRDITVRAVAAGLPADGTHVGDVMTDQVRWCFEDQPVDEVMKQMSDVQIRRVPVVDRDNRLVGIVSLGDLATRHPADVEGTLERISSPSQPDRTH
ncbi:CBS domain-containing protein [Aquabacterium sp. A7-Y]|uniref:CBS domain-containing protein n=1 Tax=Aquabacterium sp. A7-Y TaxID=1349605 RepID=UPI00223E5F94|nr:CBS domain-containing protein [Aquabacterium sp. A7-Y]MCW7539808.1 CBS domain-containing protein [Aquabacterium sp. A7-Y]